MRVSSCDVRLGTAPGGKIVFSAKVYFTGLNRRACRLGVAVASFVVNGFNAIDENRKIPGPDAAAAAALQLMQIV